MARNMCIFVISKVQLATCC